MLILPTEDACLPLCSSFTVQVQPFQEASCQPFRMQSVRKIEPCVSIYCVVQHTSDQGIKKIHFSHFWAGTFNIKVITLIRVRRLKLAGNRWRKGSWSLCKKLTCTKMVHCILVDEALWLNHLSQACFLVLQNWGLIPQYMVSGLHI